MNNYLQLINKPLLFLTLWICCAFGDPKVKLSAATCIGSSPCRACSTCGYCKLCNAGGTCGVCTPYQMKLPQKAKLNPEKSNPSKKSVTKAKNSPLKKKQTPIKT